MDKETCKELFRKYQELKKKISSESHLKEPGQQVVSQNISGEYITDVKELENVEQKLLDCLYYLTDEELIELSSDDLFKEKAQEILIKRRK